MKKDIIVDAVTKVMGVTKKELFDAETKTRKVSLARQIFAHIFLATGASALSLSTESRISPTAWRKARHTFDVAMIEDKEKAILYQRVHDIVYPPVKPTEKNKIPRIGPKWTAIEDICIERAKRKALVFMKNYGRAR